MIGEIYKTTLLSQKFCILVDVTLNKEYLKLLADLCTLRDYLRDIKDSSVRLEILLSPEAMSDVPENLGLSQTPLLDDSKSFDAQIGAIADEVDADIIFTDSTAADLEEICRGHVRVVTTSVEEVTLQAEIFVRGHEIPWAIAQPAWNMPWSSFHTMCESSGRQAWHSYCSLLPTNSLSAEAKEVLRSLLLNRFISICYTKDRLLFYRQQRSYAKRKGFTTQDYKFEIGHNLTYYYLLFWGGTDQLSFIINDLLELGFKGLGTSIAGQKFIDAIFSKNSEIGSIIVKKEYSEWLKKVKTIRHFVAHLGNITMSDLMAVPENEPSEEELEEEVKKHPYAKSIALFPEELQGTFWEMLKQQVKISKYEKTSDEAMIFDEKGSRYICFPFKYVELDFNIFENLTMEVLAQIPK